METDITLKEYQLAYKDIVIKRAKRSFLVHSLIYILVNAGLIILNLTSEPHYLWFLWPLLSWGAGLAWHFIFGVLGAGKEVEATEALAEKHAREHK